MTAIILFSVSKEDDYKDMSKKNQKEGSKTKLYWGIGIVAAILVVILLVWNSGILVKGSTAATVGDEKFSVAEVSYFYQTIENNTISQAQSYSAYGIDTGYDVSLSPSEQFQNEEENITYADYFLDQALAQLQNVTILCSEAQAEGYTLSEEGQQAVQDNLAYLTTASLQNGTSEGAYLKMVYGKFMSKSLFRDILTKAILAEEYANVKAESFTYDDSELDAYYKENAADLDQYNYRSCYINYNVETKTDADGNAVEATDEEVAAAMKVAKADADAMVAAVREGTAFNEAAVPYLAEESAASYKDDPEYGHVTGVMGNSLSSTFKDWLTGSRSAGDITAIEVPDVGYCVVQFLGRDKGEKSYQTASYRQLLVLAETTASTDEETGEEVELPTQEQLDAAKEKAESLLEQWKGGGKDADAFAALVQENSDDAQTKEAGGLVEDADRNAVSAQVQEWLFAEGRKPGQAAVVEYTDDSGNVVGYTVLFAEEFGELRWRAQAMNTLRSDDYTAWYTEIEENYPAELTSAAQKIPAL